MSQAEIKQNADAIRKELKDFDKKKERERREIVDRWKDIQEECSHPNKVGQQEGYCPDCGWTFG